MDDAAVDEPGQRVVERREVIERETILGVVGVQEVEGVLEIDVVGVPESTGEMVCVSISLTTIDPLTGYAQEGTLTK